MAGPTIVATLATVPLLLGAVAGSGGVDGPVGATVAGPLTDALDLVAVGYRPSLQTLHIGLFGAVTVLALSLSFWIYRTRRTQGAHLFASALFLVGLRTWFDVLQGLMGELWTVQTVLVTVNPIVELSVLAVFIRFVGRYAGVEWLVTDRAERALAGIVVVGAIAILTNPVHGQVFAEFHRFSAPFTYVGVSRGPLGVALLVTNALLLLVGAGLLAHAFTTGPTTAWWPAVVISLGISQALLVTGLQVTGGGLLPRYEYTAIGTAGFVLLATVALLDHGLRRIEVVARQAILDEVDDGVVFVDPDGSVADFNAAARHLFPDIDPGQRFRDLFEASDTVPLQEGTVRTEITLDVPGELVSRTASVLAEERRAGDRSEEWSDGEETRHFLVHSTQVTSETAETLGHAVRFVDVTTLKRRSRELKRKNEQLDEFASTLSHDLRNPLNVASGYLEMAAEPVEDGEGEIDIASAMTYLEKVQVSLDRMDAIIEDILALIEHADPATETEPVDFEAIANDAWATVDSKNATLSIQSGGTITADRDRLQRLLENLFRNAIDHVGDDVAIATGLEDGFFYVVDDGPGIPEEDRDQIFEYGYSTADRGTGLGLSIVAQLADAHGWDVSLEPDSQGACFVISGCETPSRPDAKPADD